MLFDYLFAVGRLHFCVPGRLGINNDEWTVSTLIETAGLVDANLFLQSAIGDFFAQSVANFVGTFVRTYLSARADENMLLEYFHNQVSFVVKLNQQLFALIDL